MEGINLPTLGRTHFSPLNATIFWLLVLLSCSNSALAEGTNSNSPRQTNLCDGLYTKGPDLHPITGLTATIRSDKSLANIKVSESSGFPDLDQSAVACAASAVIAPATVNGTPVEITWSFRMVWNAYGGHSFVLPPPGAKPCHAFYPASAIRLAAEGDTLLQFHIMPDGTVQNPTVLQSSGHDDLDNAAKTCAAGWRYPPATLNGQPIEFEWKSRVTWRLRNP